MTRTEVIVSNRFGNFWVKNKCDRKQTTMLRTFGAILFLYLFLLEASGQSFNDIPDEDVLDFQRNREFSLFS